MGDGKENGEEKESKESREKGREENRKEERRGRGGGSLLFLSRPRSEGWQRYYTMDVLSPFISIVCHSD